MSDVKQRQKKEMPVSPGRPKGVPNKLTTEVKQMILDALDSAGGVAYLASKAESHPAAFMSLVGKVLPLQVNGAGEDGEHLVSQEVTFRIIRPDGNRTN
jgi:hypothetical protein